MQPDQTNFIENQLTQGEAVNNQAMPEAAPIQEVPKETGVVQENISQVPQTPIIPDPVPVAQDPVVNNEEIKSEFTAKIDKSEEALINQAKKVMKEFDKDPYKEEEAVEDLQIGFINKKFGIKIKKSE